MSDWPKSGDSLFAAGSDWETQTFLNAINWDWFITYASSYKAAADELIESVMAQRVSPDSIAYAVLFLYRHYLELMLKALINAGNILQTGVPDFPKDQHQFEILWQKCRPLLEEVFPEGEKAETDAVESILIELHRVDPGTTFRYGVNKKGDPALRDDMQVNLAHVREIVAKLASFLEGSYECMYDMLKYRADEDYFSAC